MITSKDKIIDGKAIATEICKVVKKDVEELRKSNIIPGLAVVFVGNDPISAIYVRRKQEMAKSLGIASYIIRLDQEISEKNLIARIHSLNKDPKIHGILVQLPLPDHINSNNVIDNINSLKDVDGLTTTNIGKLNQRSEDTLIPCTPQGCMILIRSVIKDITGFNAVVIGRSNIVGKPMSTILLNNNATVTSLHSRSKDIERHVSNADIVVCAIGKPKFIKADWIKKDAIVIDVGISRVESNSKIKLSGDFDFDNLIDKVKAITPVPGGVGPMTIVCLMKNTVQATKLQKRSF